MSGYCTRPLPRSSVGDYPACVSAGKTIVFPSYLSSIQIIIGPARENSCLERARDERTGPRLGLLVVGMLDILRHCGITSKHETEASLSVSILPHI